MKSDAPISKHVGARALATTLALLACACGGPSEFDARRRDAGDGDASTPPAAPPGPFESSDASAATDAACDGAQSGCVCTGVDVTVQTQASCSISLLPGAAMDGEAFITVANANHRVFTIDRVGKGHVIAWCDGTTNKALVDAFDVRGYLAQKANPKLAAFGGTTLCSPPYLQADFTYLGYDLPTKYQNNAAQLAADYDALVFCGFGLFWSWDFSKVLVDYVKMHGRGLLVSMDYFKANFANDFAKTNALSKDFGISFDSVKLDWAEATLAVKVACVPDLPTPR